MGRHAAGLSDAEAGYRAVEAVKDLLQSIHVSCRIADYGIPREEIPKLVQGALKQTRLFRAQPAGSKRGRRAPDLRRSVLTASASSSLLPAAAGRGGFRYP